MVFFFSSRRRHTRCALVTGVQTCALPISLFAVFRPVNVKAFLAEHHLDALGHRGVVLDQQHTHGTPLGGSPIRLNLPVLTNKVNELMSPWFPGAGESGLSVLGWREIGRAHV